MEFHQFSNHMLPDAVHIGNLSSEEEDEFEAADDFQEEEEAKGDSVAVAVTTQQKKAFMDSMNAQQAAYQSSKQSTSNR